MDGRRIGTLEERRWRMSGDKEGERERNRGRKRGWFVSRTWLESESRSSLAIPFPGRRENAQDPFLGGWCMYLLRRGH